jgi:toxin ParE1/3/4
VHVLASAKEDFRRIKAWVKAKHGEAVWLAVNQQFKATLADIGQHPLAGVVTEEAQALGLEHIRQRLVGQTRVIYQFENNQVHVHMFVSTLRDFMSQLAGRLLQ